jgi:hypothetical protein
MQTFLKILSHMFIKYNFFYKWEIYTHECNECYDPTRKKGA